MGGGLTPENMLFMYNLTKKVVFLTVTGFRIFGPHKILGVPDGPIYVPEDSDTAMRAPEWRSFLFIVDGSLNPVPLCDLDQVLLKEVMAENRGLTLSDLKKRSLSTYLPHLQGINLPMAIWNLQLLRRMLTTNCLRSPALSLLLIPAVLT